mgnify:CR=1 FL=1
MLSWALAAVVLGGKWWWLVSGGGARPGLHGVVVVVVVVFLCSLVLHPIPPANRTRLVNREASRRKVQPAKWFHTFSAFWL